MWVFFSRRLRLWLILAVGAPLAAWLLGRIGDVLEARRGPNRVSRTLQAVRGWVQNRATGPFARPRADPLGARDPGTPAQG